MSSSRFLPRVIITSLEEEEEAAIKSSSQRGNIRAKRTSELRAASLASRDVQQCRNGGGVQSRSTPNSEDVRRLSGKGDMVNPRVEDGSIPERRFVQVSIATLGSPVETLSIGQYNAC